MTDVTVKTGIPGDDHVTTEVSDQGTIEVIDQGMTEVIDQGTTEVIDRGTTEVIDRGTTEVIDQGTTEVIDQGTTEVIDRGTTGVVDQGTTEVIDHVTTEVIDQGTTEVIDRGTTEGIHDPKGPTDVTKAPKIRGNDKTRGAEKNRLDPLLTTVTFQPGIQQFLSLSTTTCSHEIKKPTGIENQGHGLGKTLRTRSC
ncbi:MAG: hypothetical protein HOJ62_16040 [Planctomycetaceae bacterium]|nr:hypothetical protein [Planctomycetaceae bacterium]